MDYQIAPFAAVWSNGIFNVPNDIVDRYLKISSEYQLKALLLVLRNGGKCQTSQIAKALGQTSADVDDLMEFWIEEGVLTVDGQAPVVPAQQSITPEPEKPKKIKEVLSAPRLSPKDIVNAIRESDDIRFLVNQAQVILGKTLSQADQEMLINMVNYYGLRVEIIMMILEFYRKENERGKSIGLSYVNTMAKNWAEEGIDSLDAAETKIKSIEQSDRLWNEVVAITGIRHRRPTEKQREMVTRWFEDFDITMITLASDRMKENISEPKLPYMDSILKKWKKNNITSPAQVEAEQEAFNKSRESKSSDKLQSDPTYNLSEYEKFANDNTDI